MRRGGDQHAHKHERRPSEEAHKSSEEAKRLALSALPFMSKPYYIIGLCCYHVWLNNVVIFEKMVKRKAKVGPEVMD